MAPKPAIQTCPKPQRSAPHKPVWVPEPNYLRNKLDTTEYPTPIENLTKVWITIGDNSDPKHSPPFKHKPLPEVKLGSFKYPPPGGKPKLEMILPKRQHPQAREISQPRTNPPVRYHYELCGRDDHLAKFCYRRKAERREH